MSNVPDSLHYRESHEWIDAGQDPTPVGITHHAQEELTDVVFVELPKLGAVQVGQTVAVIESVKAASDIYAPVSGEIVEVNTALSTEPGLVNTDPYGKGWLFKIKLTNRDELSTMKSAEDYKVQIG